MLQGVFACQQKEDAFTDERAHIGLAVPPLAEATEIICAISKNPSYNKICEGIFCAPAHIEILNCLVSF